MKSIVYCLCLFMVLCCLVSTSYGASAKCTIVEINGNRMIVNCEKVLKKFTEGTKIKIKSDKTKRIEGC